MGAAVSVMISALGYNFASGTREALAYDSLKRVGKEEDYQKFASTDMMIYRVGSAAATLCAGFALFIGYKTANAIDMVLGIIGLYFAYRLVEIPAVTADSQTTYESESPARHTLSRPDCQDKEQQNLHLGTPGSKQFFKQLWLCLKNSFSFLAHSPKTRALLLVNSLIGAIATLMIFFLQAQLPFGRNPGWYS